MSLAGANEFIESLHRHHKKVQGHKFSIGVLDEEGTLRGVATIGRPVARMLDNGKRLEVTRLCTDGTKNACSALYGAAARVGREMGYEEIITYILAEEEGISLKAAGWEYDKDSPGGSWSVPSRPRVDKHPLGPKTRWKKVLNPSRYQEVA